METRNPDFHTDCMDKGGPVSFNMDSFCHLFQHDETNEMRVLFQDMLLSSMIASQTEHAKLE
jgi:hypothetical protein